MQIYHIGLCKEIKNYRGRSKSVQSRLKPFAKATTADTSSDEDTCMPSFNLYSDSKDDMLVDIRDWAEQPLITNRAKQNENKLTTPFCVENFVRTMNGGLDVGSVATGRSVRRC